MDNIATKLRAYKLKQRSSQRAAHTYPGNDNGHESLQRHVSKTFLQVNGATGHQRQSLLKGNPVGVDNENVKIKGVKNL